MFASVRLNNVSEKRQGIGRVDNLGGRYEAP